MDNFSPSVNDSFYGKFFARLNKIRVSPFQWLVGFSGVIFIRFFLETLSSPTSSGFIASDLPTLVHYGLFYGVACLSLMLVLFVFSAGKLNAPFLVLAGLPLVWLAPFLDFVLHGRLSTQMAYLFTGPGGLLGSLLGYFGPLITPGVTLGMRIEIALILITIATIIWVSTRNFFRSAGAALATYLILFALVSLPGVIYSVIGAPNGPSRIDSVGYFQSVSQTSSVIANSLRGDLLTDSSLRTIELGFNIIMSRVLYLFLFVLALLWFYITERKKFGAIIRNCRPERVLFYWSFLVLGIVAAGIPDGSWPNLLGILCLFFSWFSAWMFAVHSNDAEDAAIDAVSNPGRPIITNIINSGEMISSGYLWLTFSIAGAFLAGYYPLYMLMTYTAAYYIYSVPPLRLKRVPILSSFLISLAILSTTMAGFFFTSADKHLAAFPGASVVGIILIFTLATNVRDLKDVAGDRKEGVGTLPVLLGSVGEQLVGLFLAISFLLVPPFLNLPSLFWISTPWAVLGYFFAIRKPYCEKYIFFLYFSFAATLFIYRFWLS